MLWTIILVEGNFSIIILCLLIAIGSHGNHEYSTTQTPFGS